MPSSNASRFPCKIKISLLRFSAFALGLTGTLLVINLRLPRPAPDANGFDFTSHLNQDWSGPNVGERIDLTFFKGRQGERVTDDNGNELLMLATVEPECGAVRAARDEMRVVHDHLERIGVKYKLLSLTASGHPADFFAYSDSLGIDAPAFMLQPGGPQPLPSLSSMVIPSHILVDRNGVVLRKWPGTSQSSAIRQRMANQIVADTRAEVSARTKTLF
ncbi:MAG TPA: hypothetical protein VM934_05620 [Pyrinomonadaceae bacterium]|jgi:hypothetical protein|nr:hypothetical protein [Pyrinomonadaceae bacterium]